MIPFFIKLALGGLNILKLLGGLIQRFFASLNAQGIVGLIASLAIAFLWLHSAEETRHWRKQTGQYQTLYVNEKTSLDTLKANLLAAADKARRDDAANAVRVKAEQSAINERSAHDFETRIAAARAAAERLSHRATATNPGIGGSAPMSGLSAASGGTAQTPGEGGLSASDALTATEQAIQLDELISWVRRQHQVDPNKASPHG